MTDSYDNENPVEDDIVNQDHDKNKRTLDTNCNNTNEKTKQLDSDNSNVSFNEMQSSSSHYLSKRYSDRDILTSKIKEEISSTINAPIEIVSDSSPQENSELLISLAKEEVEVTDIDPLKAQERAAMTCKLQHLQSQLAKTKMLLNTANVEVLPDKGLKLRECLFDQEKEIQQLTLKLENTPFIQNYSTTDVYVKEEPLLEQKGSFAKDKSLDKYYQNLNNEIDLDFNNILVKPSSSKVTKLGSKAQETRDQKFTLTHERLKDLHGSLLARPSEDEKVEDPRGLQVQLMPHQQHALAWLLWREQQKPSGGILADDMGLGKTLTMISLIMTTLARKDLDESDDRSDEFDQRKSLHHKGGTLIVCPASLLLQWENEVCNKCKRGRLSVEVYHGGNRNCVPKRLAEKDMVITTYNLLTRECKNNSALYKIDWRRVILDEAHVIRNHKSQASEAVCKLMARKRWALTGTPIQNKEMDLYSILKFLQCSPFDQLTVWNRWVNNNNASGQQRLKTLMKSLMLRRTKQELQEKGALGNLPHKYLEEVTVKLDSQEELVYKKILFYSRTLFAQFLAQRAEKEHMSELYAGKYDKPSFFSNPNKCTQFTKAHNKLLEMHAGVKTHQILVLLLRLRQLCCHPALINAMLDQEDMKQSEIIDAENLDPDLLLHMNNMSLYEIENKENLESSIDEVIGDVDKEITSHVLTAKNPVFDNKRISSKMRALLDKVQEILTKGDKLIIVSQWATVLDVIASHLSSIKGATFSKFTGSVVVKDRQDIINSFNRSDSGPRILLLSLTAGGVGLNLIGGNHLLLYDIHWNPQLETQAQDRIYRFGQTKDVYIYKFICSDTIEERIKILQGRKLNIAQNILSGERNKTVAKLTFDDLKSLFAM